MTTITQTPSPHNGIAMRPEACIPLAEAPCSVNLKFAIGACGQMVQATGRGLTGAEAAKNLRETIEATKHALAPPAPPTREECLQQLYAKGLACAKSRNDFALAQRLGKAMALVTFGLVEPDHSPGTYVVRSEGTPDTWYAVDVQGHCSCPDAAYHPKRPCKHVLALTMWQRLAVSTAGKETA